MGLVMPLLSKAIEKIGSLVLSTAQWNIYDIGMNLIAMIMEGADWQGSKGTCWDFSESGFPTRRNSRKLIQLSPRQDQNERMDNQDHD